MAGLAKDATTITLGSEEPVTSVIWANHINRTMVNLNQCKIKLGTNSKLQFKIIRLGMEIKGKCKPS